MTQNRAPVKRATTVLTPPERRCHPGWRPAMPSVGRVDSRARRMIC